MEAFILSAVRTPIGKFLGSLSELPAPRLAASLVSQALHRSSVLLEQVDEVILGHVLQAGVGQNPARQAAIFGGLPESISAVTINKVCGSGLQAVMLGAQAIRAGDAQIILAGGMESMSRAPHLIQGTRTGLKFGDGVLVDELLRDGLWCAFENWPMGQAADYTAKSAHISRAEQDRFSAHSHHRASQAWASGAFSTEVIPVTVGTGSKAKTFDHDEGIRADSSVESLTKLRPAFDPSGSVTAGNSSQLSDGAALIVLGNSQAAKTRQPLARIVASVTTGVAPKDIFFAPISAIRQVVEKAQLRLNDIALFEINEAFASQLLACTKALQLDESRVNVNGGAIALGHPLGASGARVLVSLVHALHARQERFGLATLCLGGGNAVAMIIERV